MKLSMIKLHILNIKKRTLIRIQVILILYIVVFSKPPIESYAEQIDPICNSIGITYLSTHWHYEPYYLSDAEIHRDFSLFQENGLSIVTLVSVWKYIEPLPGVYNDEALNDIIRVCRIAEEYDLEIIIDFHTMMHEDSFTIPEWVEPRKFEQIFLNQSTRKAWLNYLNHSVSTLSKANNIHSWHMMNEPARSLYPETDNWACNATIDEFVTLWSEMKIVFKTHSSKPVSIRFGGNTFDTHFNRDPRIYTICDYISLNWYEEFCSRELLRDMISDIKKHAPVMISEFGYETNNDMLQDEKYRDYVELFSKTNVQCIIAWYWRADYYLGSPSGPGLGFNLADNVEGNPRSAFYRIYDDYPGFVIPESPIGTIAMITMMIAALVYSKYKIRK
jgi:hypothetical protein